ncbi:MAG: DUF4197 domain-containing protein [Pseudomonadota bacterium]
MRSIVFAAGLLCVFSGGCENTSGQDFGQVLQGVLNEVEGTSAGDQGLTQAEIDAGLRQALEIGTERVAAQIGVVDGYWKDPDIQIPLPGRLGDVQTELAKLNLSGPLDDLQLRLNRAAEAAVPSGKRIVIDAVQSITIEDALGILQGGDTAATEFLRDRTELSLRQSFTPFIEDALASSGAYQALDSVTSTQPMLATVARDYKADLTAFAVQFGLDGLFTYLAIEEKKIRDNPVARTTELLRRVFGAS